MNFISTRYFKTALLSTLFIIGSIVQIYATHLRAGEITVERVNCNSLTFRITITVYTNTRNTTVLFGGTQDVLDFGDGSEPILVPEIQNTIRYDLNPDGSVATASWSKEYTYSSPGEYIISYREPNRNEGVLNMDGSINTTFYIETVVNIDPFLGCNNTPKLLIPPIDRACPGVAWFHNPGAFDPDGDSLSYRMVIPFSDRKTEVLNYRDPNDERFYNNYSAANEDGNGPPTFSINPVTGTITWNAPGAIGEYNIAFHIVEWRKIRGEWYEMGYVRRDMQILVEDCDNERPDLIMPADTCVVAGTTLDTTIFGIDPDNDNVKIEAFSEVFNLAAAQSPAAYSPIPGVADFRPSNPPAETKFIWNTECLHIKEQPYQVVFKITDDPDNGPRLVTFKTWFIKVVGPAPEWRDAQLDLSKRQTSLKWDPYFCQNAQSMQVWRKVDGSDFVADNCQTGMPEFLGYELIATLPFKDNAGEITSYLDTNGGNGLAPGAKYCYRLVALFPSPKGGESYVSLDTCVGPILADVPIITHVTIDETDTEDGRITVSWRSPFEANTTQFPPPYRYEIYRAVGFTRGADSVLVGTTSDTTFVNTGLNTEDNIYNYSIAAYASNNDYLGSSAPASSVRLTAETRVKRIELNWEAVVPWSNQIATIPNKHIIYRSSENEPEVKIDSVDVVANGFQYIDEGQFNSTPLDDNTFYCYRIETRGGYGNPKIDEPFINFSQIICAQPGDTIPPCTPLLEVSSLNCEEFLGDKATCGENTFSNTIFWRRNREDNCDTNILGYKIYRLGSQTGDFQWISNIGRDGIVMDTFFVDTNISSYAFCYKIKAVDRSGNESEFSDPVCNDNCPYYELPNVFTPNNDGCNDLFSAYNDRTFGGEESNCGLSETTFARCARFVEKVDFKVFNRWGQEVYDYQGDITGENTIYIDWNGKDVNGADLSTGVYYYVAEVTFDIVSPTKTKIFKGWVHLIR